ncbi:MAG: SoxR reducing system RseC family protein [Spirochaetota bacterium]
MNDGAGDTRRGAAGGGPAAASEPRYRARVATERARVVAVNGRTAIVRCDAIEACSSCSSLLCSPRSRSYRAEIAVPAAPGDWVEVEIPETGAFGKGLLLFALPVVLFVAAYFAIGSAGSEVVRVTAGFGGVVVGFAAAVVASRLWNEPMPRVIRVYRDPELVPFEPPIS